MRTLPCLLLGLAPLAAQAAPSPDGLDAITIYGGSRRSVIRHLTTPYNRAGTEHSRVRNQCWRAQAFYACEQVVDGRPAMLVVYLKAPGRGRYVTHQIPADGGPSIGGTLRIEGNRWVFPWQLEDHDGRPIRARVVNEFHGRDAIDLRQEYSADGVHWTLMAIGHETRVR